MSCTRNSTNSCCMASVHIADDTGYQGKCPAGSAPLLEVALTAHALGVSVLPLIFNYLDVRCRTTVCQINQQRWARKRRGTPRAAGRAQKSQVVRCVGHRDFNRFCCILFSIALQVVALAQLLFATTVQKVRAQICNASGTGVAISWFGERRCATNLK